MIIFILKDNFMAFRTKLDYSNNRQVEQRKRTSTTLSGTTVFGVPFSALTSGPSTTDSGATETFTSKISTFSGNSATTVFTFFDSRMSAAQNQINVLTQSNSGITQNVATFSASSTTTIDGNSVNLAYTGVSFDLKVKTMGVTGSSITGTVEHQQINILSANTLDFTGRTIWVDNKEITRTKKLIVTETPQVGYVLKCVDSEGKAEWGPGGGGASGDTFVTGGTFSSTTLTLDRNDGNTITVTGFTSGGGSDTFVTGGTVSASTLTLNRNDGNSVSVTGVTGHDGFIVPTKVFPFQVMGFGGGDNLQARLLGSRPNSSVTTPMCFNQDVNLISVSANVAAATNTVTGYVGIYELVSKATTSGTNYYEYKKLHQITPTISGVNGAGAGEQILTLSTPFKFLAGKVYVVTTVNNYGAGTQPELYGIRRLGFNKLLSNTPVTSTAGYNTEYALQLSDTFASPYTFAFASAGVLPNTIWFKAVTVNTSASNMLSLTLQNA